MTYTSLTAADALAADLRRTGVTCTVNGDSGGYAVFVPLASGRTLCIAYAPALGAAYQGYDWQVIGADGVPEDSGTWHVANPADAVSHVLRFGPITEGFTSRGD